MYYNNKNICAVATPNGQGAIAIIRVSGEDSIDIINTIFTPLSPNNKPKPYKMRFGSICNGNDIIDDALVVTFNAPHSYTGENSAEIYLHGSPYIVSEVIKLLLSKGVTIAEPGEFSKRAFINGKLDLAQAEAVADLISSETKAAHRVAMQQMKGGFSNELKEMRLELLNLVSLMELELDFSEEEVEFANREELNTLLLKVSKKVDSLIDSFSVGNAIKNGVPVAIVGATNTGKSTLLNRLSGEERAIVSNIPGTTRDSIEDIVNIEGISFRFIDTAGIRATDETIEKIGIERSYKKLEEASVVLLMLDLTRESALNKESLDLVLNKFNSINQKLIILLNKCDIETDYNTITADIKSNLNNLSPIDIIPISAKENINIDILKHSLIKSQQSIKNISTSNATFITNIRHYQALKEAKVSLDRVNEGLSSTLPTDLVAQDIREALYHLGSIVGEISTNEILGNIFKNFCIGK